MRAGEILRLVFSGTPFLVFVTAAFLLGYVIRGSAVQLRGGTLILGEPGSSVRTSADQSERQAKYACSMFCLPPRSKPGKCPVCGMEMLVVGENQSNRAEEDSALLTLSPRAQKLAAIATASVERKFVSRNIRMVGQVDYDEYNKARNRPYRVGKQGRSIGKAVARLGVTLDAYEPDLAWIRLGQPVAMEADACPGKVMQGTIVFIDGKLDNFTRTVEVRVRVRNLDERLKLGMLIRAKISATLDKEGNVISPAIVGKWLCPMHADVAKDGFGKCDQCGIDLREAASLGYYADDGPAEPPLVIPATAPLITGRRAVVYLAVPGRLGSFIGRTIVLGPRAGDQYIVREGLEVGDRVVVNGNFKIDSSLQILAKPSMMSPSMMIRAPTGGAPNVPPAAGGRMASNDSSAGLRRGFAAYFLLHSALSRDNLAEARRAAELIGSAIQNESKMSPGQRPDGTWSTQRTILLRSLDQFERAETIDEARTIFEPISNSLIVVARQFGTGISQPVYHFRCPMAFDNRGADWLQRDDQAENPYFGATMFRCGVMTESFPQVPVTNRNEDR